MHNVFGQFNWIPMLFQLTSIGIQSDYPNCPVGLFKQNSAQGIKRKEMEGRGKLKK